MLKYLVGIDEVGRGPVAGPVAVGVVVIPKDFDRKFFRGIKDSKKLSQKEREEWLKKAKTQKAKGKINFRVSMVSNKVIDEKGIAFAIRVAISRSLNSLKLNPKECQVLLDGGLKAPERFSFQKTIKKGDEKETAIALASIVAKVTRDKKMISFSKKLSAWQFERHKGYGTKNHIQKIKEYGLCPIHRRSFLSNFKI